MQAVQDLTVEDRVSRTQYQYSLEAADANGSGHLGAQLVQKLQALPNCATSPPTSRIDALEENLVVDRDTASRLGITTAAIDDTLYDAFGQRQVSTMFTQLNQYHVVWRSRPNSAQNPDALEKSLC